MIPDSIVEEVRLRADIVETIGEHLQLKRAGREFRALCPFHHEKTPSFYVVPAKGFFKCFGCGESGDVFGFLMKHVGMSFTDAVRHVAAKVGVEIPDVQAGRDAEEPHRVLYEAIAFAEDFFRRMLREDAAGEQARQYIARRALDDASLDRFRIGYAPEAWRALREAAHRHGIEDDVLLEAGLIKQNERSEEPYDRFRDRIIFPIAEPGDRTIAFGGRLRGRGGENAPKYLNSPETPIYHKGRVLYGLNWAKGAIRRDGGALVVEGYMDFVSLAGRGIENVVAGMGTALTPEQANLIARYAHRAYLLYDSDTAGQRATFRSADALLRAGVHPLVVTLPAGEDPDSLARTGGAAAVQVLLARAVDVLEHKLQILKERGLLEGIEGKRRALDRLLPTLRAAVDPTLRDLYIDTVAQRTGVQRDTLEREMSAAVRGTEAREASTPRRFTRPAPGRDLPAHVRRDGAERLLVLMMSRDPSWIEAAATDVTASDVSDPIYRELFIALLDALSVHGGDGQPPASWISEGVSDLARQTLAELERDPLEIDGDRTFRDVVATIRAAPLFLRLDDIRARLAAAVGEEQTSLMIERRRIAEALRALDARGFKFSTRFRRHARSGRPGQRTPSTEDV